MKKLLKLCLRLPTLLLLFSIVQVCAQAPVGDLVGVNARAKDQINDKLQQFALVREYHGWESDQSIPDNTDIDCIVGPLKWNPTADQTDFTNFDDFYDEFNGIAYPVLKSVNYQMRGLDHYDQAILEQKPYCQGYSNVNSTTGWRSNQGGPTIETPIPVNYESQYFLEADNDEVALWIDPVYGADGEISRVYVRCAGFNNVSSFSIILSWGGQWFVDPQGANFDWHPNLSSNPTTCNPPDCVDWNLTIDWTGTNSTIPDGEILYSFDLVPNGQEPYNRAIQFFDVQVDLNGTPVSEANILTQDRVLRTHSINDVNYFVNSGSNPFANNCTNDYCFELWSTGYQALISSGVNIV